MQHLICLVHAGIVSKFKMFTKDVNEIMKNQESRLLFMLFEREEFYMKKL